MNIIFSHTEDYTTKLVLEWMDYLGGEFIRVNDERIDIKRISITNKDYNFSLKIGEKFIEKKDINAIWFRGGNVQIAVLMLKSPTLCIVNP